MRPSLPVPCNGHWDCPPGQICDMTPLTTISKAPSGNGQSKCKPPPPRGGKRRR